MNAGFNFFGRTNTVAAGPGPLALAGAVFRDFVTVTQANPGIAINNNPVGGAATTSNGPETRVATTSNGPETRVAATSNGPETRAAASGKKPVTTPLSRRIKDAVSAFTGGHIGRAPASDTDATAKKDNTDGNEDNTDATGNKDNTDATGNKDR